MVRTLRPLVAVAIGGMVGSLVRWTLVELASPDRVRSATFAINVAGSILLGALIGRREQMRPERLLGLGTGFAGGLTTFSSYAVTVATDLEEGELLTAAANGFATPLVTLVAAGIGFRVMRVAVATSPVRRWSRR